MRPGFLWYMSSGTINRVQIIPLRRESGEVAYLLPCGQCGQQFILYESVGLSYDALGAVSTVHAFSCPHCRSWHVWLDGGVVTVVTKLHCPSCELELELPPHFGWVQCTYCQYEGRMSEALPEPPAPEPTP